MEPLILKFAEDLQHSPTQDTPDYQYCEVLNLNILKNGEYAIDHNLLATETGTRASKEDSDSDKSFSAGVNMLATESFTKASGEGTDTDKTCYNN
jgi:hypothetical protein